MDNYITKIILVLICTTISLQQSTLAQDLIVSSCPTIIERSDEGTREGNYVSWPEIMAFSQGGEVPARTAYQSHYSGNYFLIGDTNVSYVFMDDFNNTAFCNFTVRVLHYDDCRSIPCRNGGSCFTVDERNYQCYCQAGFTGDYCETKEMVCRNFSTNTSYGKATLGETEVGSTVNSREKCPRLSFEGEKPIITAVCRLHNATNATYYDTKINCGRNLTALLQQILEGGVSEDIAEYLFEITTYDDEIGPIDIQLIQTILDELVNLNTTSENFTVLITRIVNNVMNVDEVVLAEAQAESDSTTRIIQTLETQLNNIDVPLDVPFESSLQNLAVQVRNVSLGDVLDGIVLTLFGMDVMNFSNSNITVESHGDTSTTVIPDETFGRVVLPREVAQLPVSEPTSPETKTGTPLTTVPFGTTATTLAETTSPETNTGTPPTTVPSAPTAAEITGTSRIVFVVYASDVVFPSQSSSRSVNTPVVSISVGRRKIENLMERVNISFLRLMSNSREPECNFWDFSLSNWSTRGCELVRFSGENVSTVDSSITDETTEEENDYYTCACDHFTNFAVLVDIYAEEEPHKPILRLLSIVGCGISCIFLVVTLASYLSIKKVRNSQTQRIFICLCATLLFLYICALLVVALDTKYQFQEIESIPCTVLAALLHYFVLSSLTWMGIEGFNIYLIIIRVFDTYIPKYLLKAGIVGWGLPAVIVGATGGIARNTYALDDYCYIQLWPVIGGLLIPMAIILLINIVIFTLAICRIAKSARFAGRVKKVSERQETMERIQNGVSMLVLLGLPWITGYLTLLQVDVAELLFIIFNSLQGFFIFVLYCLRKATIREQWRRCLCCTCSEDASTDKSKPMHGVQTSSQTTNRSGETHHASESVSSMSHSNPAYYP